MKVGDNKPVHILLTDGLSQILEIKSEEQAIKMVKMFNENSDSGWEYKVRLSPCPK